MSGLCRRSGLNLLWCTTDCGLLAVFRTVHTLLTTDGLLTILGGRFSIDSRGHFGVLGWVGVVESTEKPFEWCLFAGGLRDGSPFYFFSLNGRLGGFIFRVVHADIPVLVNGGCS